MAPDDVRNELSALRSRLGGRAAGVWRVSGDRLVLVAFDPAPDLPGAVARGFESATRAVELTPTPLGIVGAALSGETCVSIAADLPADAGSGLWLRAFGAARSVAVPIEGRDGRTAFVVSVALGLEPEASAVSSMIQVIGWD